MKTIAITKFREQCLSIVDRLDAEGLIVTKRGRPVARLLPIERSSADLIGSLAGRIVIHGDLGSADADWDASARS